VGEQWKRNDNWLVGLFRRIDNREVEAV